MGSARRSAHRHGGGRWHPVGARVDSPGAVGLGDVTLCALVGCAVGGHSPTAFVLWWMCMAAIGAGWILAWQALRHMQMTGAHGKAPFAPVIVAAGVAAIAFLG